MDDQKTIAPLATDVLRVELESNGPIASHASQEIEELLQSNAPRPKGHFRPVEFPDEAVEAAHDRLRELAALSTERDEMMARNPPAADEKDRRLAELEAGIRASMRALGHVRIEIRLTDDDPFDLFAPDAD